MSKELYFEVGQTVYVEDHGGISGHGVVTNVYENHYGYLHEVKLNVGDGYVLSAPMSKLTKINTTNLGTVGVDNSKREATIAAVKADIEVTEQTLRNLKSALVLIEGA